MAIPKQIKLVNGLIQKTRDGVLKWEPTADQGAYQVAFSDFGVRISIDDKGNERDVVIEIVSWDGTVIEEVRDTAFDRGDFGGGDNATPFKVMLGLFEMARRKALGADAAIDAILANLDNIKP